MNHQDLLTELTARLPELEWKMRDFHSVIPMHNIPKGLFRCQHKPLTSASCIAEIKEDIQFLYLQKNQQSSEYIASRMRQKVNVLVFLCQKKQKAQNSKDKPKVDVRLKALSTRAQWVQTLEEEIQALEQQERAIRKMLIQTQQRNDVPLLLSMRAELGAIEEQLTITQEKLAQIIF